MKVKLKNIRQGIRPNQVGIIQEFVKFLNRNMKLRNDISIRFVELRDDKMTTGRHKGDDLVVFTKSRILVDILRTLAHEWIHEIQDEYWKIQPTGERAQEDHANSISGYLLRKFMKQNPSIEAELYKD